MVSRNDMKVWPSRKCGIGTNRKILSGKKRAMVKKSKNVFP